MICKHCQAEFEPFMTGQVACVDCAVERAKSWEGHERSGRKAKKTSPAEEFIAEDMSKSLDNSHAKWLDENSVKGDGGLLERLGPEQYAAIQRVNAEGDDGIYRPFWGF
jgi:hypothetical protein